MSMTDIFTEYILHFFCNYRSQGGYVICDRLILTLGVLFNQALGHFIFRLNLSFKPNRNLDA